MFYYHSRNSKRSHNIEGKLFVLQCFYFLITMNVMIFNLNLHEIIKCFFNARKITLNQVLKKKKTLQYR